MSRMRTLLPTGLVGGLLLTAACGLPEQDQAQVLDGVPIDLLAVTSTTSAELAEVEADAAFELVLYWHDSDQGGRLIRNVRQRGTAPTPQEAIEQLIAGPTEQEVAETESLIFGPNTGLTDEQLAPVVGEPAEGIVTVTVAGTAFRELPNKANAAAELVCTLTEFENIDGVIVKDLQPDPIGLVGANSESIEGPARRENFDDCVPANPPPEGEETTTTSEG